MSKPDSKQLVILKRITALIETIAKPDDDYDLAGHVFRGRPIFGAQDITPFVSVLESLRPDPSTIGAGSNKIAHLEWWELLIQGWIEIKDKAHPTDELYGLKAAVESRLARIVQTGVTGSAAYPDDYRLGGLVADVRIGPGVVRAATPGSGGVEAFYLPLMVQYAINSSDPWALTVRG